MDINKKQEEKKLMIFPKTREDDILTQELLDEILIYDTVIDKVYSLNQTLTAVYYACDGKKSVAEIRETVSRQFSSPVTDEFVLLSLKQLDENGLMANSEQLRSEINFNAMSRRKLIKKVGLATLLALPVISILVAPEAAGAASSCTALYLDPCNQTGPPCCVAPYVCNKSINRCFFV